MASRYRHHHLNSHHQRTVSASSASSHRPTSRCFSSLDLDGENLLVLIPPDQRPAVVQPLGSACCEPSQQQPFQHPQCLLQTLSPVSETSPVGLPQQPPNMDAPVPVPPPPAAVPAVVPVARAAPPAAIVPAAAVFPVAQPPSGAPPVPQPQPHVPASGAAGVPVPPSAMSVSKIHVPQPPQQPPPLLLSAAAASVSASVSVPSAAAAPTSSEAPSASAAAVAAVPSAGKPGGSSAPVPPRPPAEPFPGVEAQRASIEKAKEAFLKRLESLQIDEAAMFSVDRWGNVREPSDDAEGQEGAPAAASKKQQAAMAKRELEAEKLWRQKVKVWRQMKPAELKRLVRQGIPDSFRATAWARLSGALHRMDANPGVYEQAVDQGRDCEHAATIFRDLDRTWPRHVFFRDPRGDRNKESEGRDRLGNVLRAYSVYNARVGYTQGMGFVVGIFLMYFEEEEAFWMLDTLLTDPKYALAGLYEPGFPLMFRHCSQLEGLLRERFPKVQAALQKHGCIPPVYATQWFMTLFTYNFPFNVVLRLMDILLSEGHKIIFRVSLFHMQRSRTAILAANKANPDPGEGMIPILTVLKNINKDPLLRDADEYIKAVLKVRVTHAELERLAQQDQQQKQR